jgi:uncharacterized oligopeptide transporter (OPT) family protein
MNELRRRQERLDRARRLARLELLLAVVAPVLAAFLFVAAPGHMGGPVSGSWVSDLGIGVAVVGMVGVIVGPVSMVLIYRADPEPDQGAWRYRRF